MNRSTLRLSLAAIALAAASSLASAQMSTLASKLPPASNAVLTVDVKALLDTPLANKEAWQSKMLKGYADRPFALPPSASKVVMGAFIHPAEFDAVWQSAIVELPGAPRLEPMLDKQGGYIDRLGELKAVWTSKDTYYIELGANSLGILRPGDRQFASRWTSGASTARLSPYLTTAVGSLEGAQVLFAMDLENAVGPAATGYAFASGLLPALESMGVGRDALLRNLGTAKGVKLALTVTSEINGTLTIEFDQDVSALGERAKDFVSNVLTNAGLAHSDAGNWTFTAQGKTIVGTGKASPDVITSLMAIMSPGDVSQAHKATATAQPAAPAPAQPAAAQGAPATPADPSVAGSQSAQPVSPAEASLAYYRAVSKMLDQMRGQSSMSDGAKWLMSRARMIEQLPILGVDPMLIEWGTSVANTFYQSAQVMGIGQINARVASDSVEAPYVGQAWNGYNDGWGGGGYDGSERTSLTNFQRQKRVAAQSQRATSANQAATLINQVMESRGQVRQAMVQKYNIEF